MFKVEVEVTRCVNCPLLIEAGHMTHSCTANAFENKHWLDLYAINIHMNCPYDGEV